jgi:hypothetical protein
MSEAAIALALSTVTSSPAAIAAFRWRTMTFVFGEMHYYRAEQLVVLLLSSLAKLEKTPQRHEKCRRRLCRCRHQCGQTTL